MDAIMNFDIEVFRFINTGMTAPFLDTVMTFVTDKMNFFGAVIVAAALIWILGKRQDRVGLVVLVLLIISSDLAANAFKHAFTRLRPCHALEGARALAGYVLDRRGKRTIVVFFANHPNAGATKAAQDALLACVYERSC